MYIDKAALDSKKFKMNLAGILSIALTAILAPRLGPVTGTVVDYLANYGAEAIMGGVVVVYTYVQGQVDKALAEANKTVDNPANKPAV